MVRVLTKINPVGSSLTERILQAVVRGDFLVAEKMITRAENARA